jgi:hypothetical protein
VTENNRPSNIVNDRELRELLKAGRPNIEIPSPWTVNRDIQASFKKCRDHITKLLQQYPGRLHFATDAWTSPNHRVFVAWTVHMEHEGRMVTFLLDIVEVPESHTGQALANAFQTMLEQFGLQNKVMYPHTHDLQLLIISRCYRTMGTMHPPTTLKLSHSLRRTTRLRSATADDVSITQCSLLRMLFSAFLLETATVRQTISKVHQYP